jgi:hypothetical protein
MSDYLGCKVLIPNEGREVFTVVEQDGDTLGLSSYLLYINVKDVLFIPKELEAEVYTVFYEELSLDGYFKIMNDLKEPDNE